MMLVMGKRIKFGAPKVAVAYIRVSKDEQKLGPEAQRASIEQWAARDGVSVVSWHVEHVTSVAPIDARAGLVEALSALKAHSAGVLVVAKRDRIARDPGLAASIEHAARAACNCNSSSRSRCWRCR
jgi:DNA invertase Pin-like site-specific DNA recombinase